MSKSKGNGRRVAVASRQLRAEGYSSLEPFGSSNCSFILYITAFKQEKSELDRLGLRGDPASRLTEKRGCLA
jgi:hypothetical protein